MLQSRGSKSCWRGRSITLPPTHFVQAGAEPFDLSDPTQQVSVARAITLMLFDQLGHLIDCGIRGCRCKENRRRPCQNIGEDGQRSRWDCTALNPKGSSDLCPLVAFLFVAKSVYTDWLWFGSLGFRGVFNKILGMRIGLFFVGALVMVCLLIPNLYLAYRFSKGESILPGLNRVLSFAASTSTSLWDG